MSSADPSLSLSNLLQINGGSSVKIIFCAWPSSPPDRQKLLNLNDKKIFGQDFNYTVTPPRPPTRITPTRIVIRNVPRDFDVEEIKFYITEQLKSAPINVQQILYKGKPTPLYRVTMSNKQLASSLLQNGAKLGYTLCPCEMARDPPPAIQCKKCWEFGHLGQNCTKGSLICGRCSGDHGTFLCKLDKNTPSNCVNCGGQHRASYQGCPVAREAAKATPIPLQPKQNYSAVVSSKNFPKQKIHSPPEPIISHPQIYQNFLQEALDKIQESQSKFMLQMTQFLVGALSDLSLKLAYASPQNLVTQQQISNILVENTKKAFNSNFQLPSQNTPLPPSASNLLENLTNFQNATNENSLISESPASLSPNQITKNA